jgi:hypothetical protein
MLEQYESHPAAAAFPLMVGRDYAELVDDIKRNGLRDDIVRFPGRKRTLVVILDGRNRFRACLDAGVQPRFVDFDGDDPFAFVISANLRRRHMNESQRALVAARLAMLGPGRPTKLRRSAELSAKQASHHLNVGERTVERARSVLKKAVPEIVAAIDRGDMTVEAAADLASRGRREQRELVGRLQAPPAQQQTKHGSVASVARALSSSDLIALNALAEVGDEAHDPRARAGVVVLRRIVPAVAARG